MFAFGLKSYTKTLGIYSVETIKQLYRDSRGLDSVSTFAPTCNYEILKKHNSFSVYARKKIKLITKNIRQKRYALLRSLEGWGLAFDGRLLISLADHFATGKFAMLK
jgi:hypothetical protein